MFTHLLETQKPAVTILIFVGTFFAALLIGRLLKRRAGVRLGLLYQLFCLTLAFYAAIAFYGVQQRDSKSCECRRDFAQHRLSSSPCSIAIFGRLISKRNARRPSRICSGRSSALGHFLVALLLVLSLGLQRRGRIEGPARRFRHSGDHPRLRPQNLLGGIIAGMSLQISKPYKVGDWLKIEDHFAEVMEINWRSTRLRTNDAIYLDIPNNEIVARDDHQSALPDADPRDAHPGGGRTTTSRPTG